MDYKIQDSDIDILRKAGVSGDDIKHCVKVAEKALEIAGRAKANVDMELIGRGALFHDLGKAKTHEIEHGKIGAEMGRTLGLSQAITDIMEKHIRGGLTEEEIDKVLIKQEEELKKFGEIALEDGLLTETQIKELLKEQKDDYIYFGEALVKLGVLSEEEMIKQLKMFNAERLRH